MSRKKYIYLFMLKRNVQLLLLLILIGRTDLLSVSFLSVLTEYEEQNPMFSPNSNLF